MRYIATIIKSSITGITGQQKIILLICGTGSQCVLIPWGRWMTSTGQERKSSVLKKPVMETPDQADMPTIW